MWWLSIVMLTGFSVACGVYAQHILLGGSSGNRTNYRSKRTTGLLLPLQVLVGTTIAVSALIACFVLCEIGNWVDPNAREMLWRLSISIVVGLLVVADPIAEIWMTLGKVISNPSMRLTLTAAVYGCFFTAFYLLGHYIPMFIDVTDTTAAKAAASGATGTNAWSVPSNVSNLVISTAGPIARITFLGITAMAMLCGISTISAPYIVFFAKNKRVTQADIDRMEGSLVSTGNLIEQRRESVRTLSLQLSSQSKSSSNLMFKVLTSFKGGDGMATEINGLRTEINALENVYQELERDLEIARTTRASQLYQTTTSGRVSRVLYACFAIYCIYRAFNILVRLLRSRFGWHGESDALVITLSRVVAHFGRSSDVEGMTRQIGFLVSGALFIASISSVVTTVGKIKRSVGPISALSSYIDKELGSVIIAQVIATYTLSTALLLRSNLPHSMSSAITSAIGAPIDPDVAQTWSDLVHIWTATATMVILWLSLRMEYTSKEFDEESAIETKYD